jgi:hypothetical protein
MVIVIIPVYKQQLEDFEQASLKNCLRRLHNYSLCFVGPEGLDTRVYETACQDLVPFVYHAFDTGFFGSIRGYNQLMLSAGFYQTFRGYKYMLIHQLDAYVFRDDLTYWCRQGYDFIGAPALPHQNQAGSMEFLKGYQKLLDTVNAIFQTRLSVRNVGNGGFSLRNIRKCYWLLKLLKSRIRAWGENNEDGFFKYWGNLLFPLFRLPKEEVALRFSIEHHPAESLEKLKGGLPFGCHAFEKYEPETWRRFIPY